MRFGFESSGGGCAGRHGECYGHLPSASVRSARRGSEGPSGTWVGKLRVSFCLFTGLLSSLPCCFLLTLFFLVCCHICNAPGLTRLRRCTAANPRAAAACAAAVADVSADAAGVSADAALGTSQRPSQWLAMSSFALNWRWLSAIFQWYAAHCYCCCGCLFVSFFRCTRFHWCISHGRCS